MRSSFLLAAALAVVLAVASVEGRTFVRPEQAGTRADKLKDATSNGFPFGFRQYDHTQYPFGACLNGKAYEVQFNISAPAEQSFVRIDTAPGYTGTTVCNIDHTAIYVEFDSAANAEAFRQQLLQGNPVLTGQQGLAECEENFGMFRRISTVADSVSAVYGNPSKPGDATAYSVEVRAFKAAYDQVLESGTVSFGPSPADSPMARICESPSVNDPATFCLGINANQQCTGTAGPLELYQNQYINVQCSNCFMAFDVTVDLELKMKDFLLWDAHYKFGSMSMSGALVATLNAQDTWSANADATFDIVGPTTVVQFWLGPLPVSISFEVPMTRTATASFDATANAQAGAEINWQFGDYEVMWNPLDGWNVAAGEPGLVYKTQVSGEAQFNGAAQFGLAPSLTVHLDSFFQTTIDFNAMVHATVAGSTQNMQICANVDYATSAGCSAELYVSIPWVNLDKSYSWQATWFDITGTVPQQCVGAHTMPALPALPAPAALPAKKEVPVIVQSRSPRKQDGPMVRLKGTDNRCFKEKGYAMNYDVTMPAAYNFINVDSVPGVKKVTCNAGGGKFRLEFHHKSDRQRFASQISTFNTFLTGSYATSQLCGNTEDTKVFLQRVIGLTDASITMFDEVEEVSVAPARYDEVFQNATISLGPDSSVLCGVGSTTPDAEAVREGMSKHVCLGVNANAQCTAAAASIPLFSDDHITLSCSNCYMAFQTDIFFNLEIADWELKTLQGGFQNISVDAGLVMQIVAQMQWSAGTSSNKDAVPPTTILDFAVGPVPIRLWFEIPLNMNSQLSASAQASFSAGVLAQFVIGDYYVSWSEGNWTIVKPTPKLSWEPSVSALQASFQAQYVLELEPTFAFHVDSVFWATLQLDPQLHLNANATLATKQVCLQGDASMTATALVELDMNVPIIHLHAGGKWGPSQVYNGDKQLINKCVSF